MSLNGDIESLKKKIKRHEDNIEFLNSQQNRIAESIHSLRMRLVRYHSANSTKVIANDDDFHSEEEIEEKILKKKDTAAGILCWLKANMLTLSLNLEFAKDAVGIVATLGRVEGDDLSRILSEYLGLENMLAIVCNTLGGVKALEEYDAEGKIHCNVGLHGFGSSIGRRIQGRFVVICLEALSPFSGDCVANYPQKKLAIPKPRLPNAECPAGFIDYAVNMIHLDSNNISFITSTGHSLRETLFYGLFARLQVYNTRNDMLLALPCINEGALSLDGGMIKKNGMFALGSRKDVDVRFPLISPESEEFPNYIQAEVRKLQWESSKLAADIKREIQLLEYEKGASQVKPEKPV